MNSIDIMATNSLVKKLMTPPRPEKGVEMPHFSRGYKPGVLAQADLLFLPTDKGYKYLLLIFDAGSRMTDGEPLKAKDGNTVVNAFKNIFSRGIVKMPSYIGFDDGSEFKGKVAKFFEDNDVKVRVALPHRHRQQALIERRNAMIGKKIFENILAEELATGKPNAEWIDDFRGILKNMNEKAKVSKVKKESDEYVPTPFNREILPEGTLVRVALDAPIDPITKKPLHGNFRKGDIRWEIAPRKIARFIIVPGQPPMYILEGKDGKEDRRASYTRNRLQVVNSNEVKPQPKERKKDEEIFYVIDKLVGKRVQRGKVRYLVHWKGYDKSEDSWVSEKSLVEDGNQALINRYERSLVK